MLANYVRTAVSSGDAKKVKAVLTEKAAHNVDAVLAGIPAGTTLQTPSCASAGNSVVVHCTMFVQGAPIALELGTAKNPKTGAWEGTSISYDSTD